MPSRSPASVPSTRRPWLGLVLALLLPPPAEARWEVEVVEGPHLEAGDLALRSDDEPVAAWGGRLVEVATRQAGAWTIEAVTPEPGSYWSVSLELDEADRPVVAWLDHPDGTVHLARHDGAGWTEETIPLPSPVEWWCSLALDSAGRPWIAYRDAAERALGLARHDGAAWIVETVAATGDTGTWPSLVLDALDRPLIAHRDEAAQTLRLSRFDGSAWSHETVDPAPDGAGRNVRLALAGGEPVIAYARNQRDSLVVSRWVGFWVRDALGGGLGHVAAMGTGADGSVHVASIGRRHWRHDGAAWQGGAAAKSFGGRIAALDVDSLGRPWVLGFDHDERPDRNTPDAGCVLVSWRAEDGTWSHEVVRDGDDRRRNLATLSLDSSGRPAVAWEDLTNSRTEQDVRHRLAERLDTGWTAQDVAPPSTSRAWHSLAHDLEDRPLVAFAEASPSRGLFLARREAGGWTRLQLEGAFACCTIGLTVDGEGTAFTAYTTAAALRIKREQGAGTAFDDIEPGRNSGDQVSMATLTDGRPAVAFETVTDQWAYAEREADGTWSVELIDVLDGTCSRPSLAVAPDGRPWSSSSRYYSLGDWGVRVARREGGVWVVEEVARVFTESLVRTSIVALADGQPAVAWSHDGVTIVARRAPDGSWSRTELPVARIDHDHALRADAAGGLWLAHQEEAAVRVARRPAAAAEAVNLHRGVVGSVVPGWQDAALPLTVDNDDETPPFPVAVEPGGGTLDDSPPAAPLVLYLLLTDAGEAVDSVTLTVTKDPAGAGLLIGH